jgi:hypothetical protein
VSQRGKGQRRTYTNTAHRQHTSRVQSALEFKPLLYTHAHVSLAYNPHTTHGNRSTQRLAATHTLTNTHSHTHKHSQAHAQTLIHNHTHAHTGTNTARTHTRTHTKDTPRRITPSRVPAWATPRPASCPGPWRRRSPVAGMHCCPCPAPGLPLPLHASACHPGPQAPRSRQRARCWPQPRSHSACWAHAGQQLLLGIRRTRAGLRREGGAVLGKHVLDPQRTLVCAEQKDGMACKQKRHTRRGHVPGTKTSTHRSWRELTGERAAAWRHSLTDCHPRCPQSPSGCGSAG